MYTPGGRSLNRGAEELNRKNMYRRALSVAWPAMMESFFITLAGMIDTMMVAELGSYAVAAVGLTAQPKFIGLTLFIGMNVAVSALVARRKGEERPEDANEIVWTAVLLTLILCVLILAFTLRQIGKYSGGKGETVSAKVKKKSGVKYCFYEKSNRSTLY